MTPDGTPLILSADKLQPGDFVSEYDDTVTAVKVSERHLGVREVTFAGQPGTFHLHFSEWMHVGRTDAEDTRPAIPAPVRDQKWEW